MSARVCPGVSRRKRIRCEVKLGEVITVDYIVTNQSARETLGVAAYNVAPLNYGVYFQKINCFCFNEQRMKAGETRHMTVVFYVDPAMANDPDVADARQHHAVLHLLSAARAAASGCRPVRGRAPRATELDEFDTRD